MRFSHDRRGQSVVIGTVILFGFLILALSLYQVQVVPQQNGQVEFQHFEEVRNDLVELRAGILQAGSTDRPQYQTVRLGTSYSTRLFAINPPAPAGTIRTVESPPITISNGSDTPEGTVTIPTRFIQYRPGYNEIDQSPTWYDASVLYVDASEEGGGIAVIEDQELVTENGTVRITAIQNEFRQSGTGRVTLELYPTENANKTLPQGDNLTVIIPTRLSEKYWNGTDIPEDIYQGVSDDNGDEIYNLTLNTTDMVEINTVGIQSSPDKDSSARTIRTPPSVNPDPSDPQISLRIDDLSHANENRGQFITSFEVQNAGNAFERVEVEYDYLSGGGQDQTETVSNTRGRSEYVAGGTAGGNFDIRVTAIGEDSNGDEFQLATRTVETTANAVNPVEDGLGSGGLSFQSVVFDDRSNNGQGPRYRIDYTVDNTPEFNRVEGYSVSVTQNNGGRDSGQNIATSGRIDLNTYGYNSDFKLVALVVDNDGVVVDAQITTDEADGNNP